MQLRKLTTKLLRAQIAPGLALIWILTATTTASAQCPLLFSAQLSARQQDLVDQEVSPTLIKSTMKQIKITTSDVLKVLATHYSTTFPSGSKICFHRDSGDTTMNVYDGKNTLLLKVDESVMDLLARPEPTFDIYTVPDAWLVQCSTLDPPPDPCIDIPLQILRHTNANILALSRTRSYSFVAGEYWTIGTMQLISAPAMIDVVLSGMLYSKFSWVMPSSILQTQETIDVMSRGQLNGKPTLFTGTIRFLGKLPLLNVAPPPPP